jgi:hypothetical protein
MGCFNDTYNLSAIEQLVERLVPLGMPECVGGDGWRLGVVRRQRLNPLSREACSPKLAIRITHDRCGTPGASTQSVSVSPLHDPPTCPYMPDDLQAMMEKQLRAAPGFGQCECCAWPDCPRYNELVLDPATWIDHLPYTVEAFVYPVDMASSAELAYTARQLQASFRRAFNSSTHAWGVPVLAFNRSSNADAFTLVQ